MVEFKKRAVKPRGANPLQYKRKYTKKTKKGGGFFLKTFLFLALLGTICAAIGFFVLYIKYIKPLPPVDQLETMAIPEASIIYDSEGNELYTFYGEEKRTYVPYENISQNMINAIIAVEDQNFFENKGVDPVRMAGAVVDYIVGRKGGIEGTSTISQQLIRNTLIGNERKIERKIKEVYLSYKMNTKLSKQKIMELYLNKISFGSNAYGIEQAAKTFYGKSSSDLTILESSMLASLPKGPTAFSPYRHYERTVGAAYAYNNENPEETINILTKKDRVIYASQVEKLKELIGKLQGKRLSTKDILVCGIEEEFYKKKISLDIDGCKIFKYSDLTGILNNFIIEGEKETVEYQTGRKDIILALMLDQNYISFDEYRQATLDSFGYDFKAYKEDIKYPHFVFYVKEFLVEKYGQELIEQGGLKIFTSLEPTLQNKAQEIVEGQIASNTALYGAKNAALISIDNRTGNIVAMVGGGDYYDTENKGNVNVATSPLQPGSSFKPFVYALAIDKNPIGTKTPIYDVETTFPGSPSYTPSNFDGKFKGKMSLTSALNQSRNIPAIKMYYLAGGQANIVDFVNNIGGKSLKAGQYGPSLALGTGLMTPLDIASAYTTFANMGYKKDISPIKRIQDSRGNVIEELDPKKNIGELVIDQSLAYILNYMLSDSGERPEYWNKFLTLKDRKVAAKTGTSTFQYKKNGKDIKLPRNLWTAGYTPQYTTVVWAGNTDGTPLTQKGNGLEGAGPIWKKFMDFVHIGEEVQNWKQPQGVKQASISNISGFLPGKSTPASFILSSLFKNVPVKYDSSTKSVQYDALCKGQVSEKTPEGAIKTGVFIALNSLKPNLPSWENPVQAWGKNGGLAIIGNQNSANVISGGLAGPCPERVSYENSKIELGTSLRNGDTVAPGSNNIEIGFRNPNPIQEIEFYAGGELVQTINTGGKLKGVIRPTFYAPASAKSIQLRIRAVDSLFYAQDRSITLNIEKDSVAPVINLVNPAGGSISIYEEDAFNLRANITEISVLRTINIYQNGKILSSGNTNKSVVYLINQNGALPAGQHTVTIEAIDQSFNKSSKSISVTVLEGVNPNKPASAPEENTEATANESSNEEEEASEVIQESVEGLLPDEPVEPESNEEAPESDESTSTDEAPVEDEVSENSPEASSEEDISVTDETEEIASLTPAPDSDLEDSELDTNE